jgi:subfamily B ATP-binding cassette protein MsbA
MGDLTHVASETIQGYRVVRSFGGEDYESTRFRQRARTTRPSSCAWSEQRNLHPGAAVRHLQPRWRCCCSGPGCCAAMPRPATWSPTSPPPACCRSRFASFPKSARRFRKGWPGREHLPSSTKRRSPITARSSARSRQRPLEVKDLSFGYPGSKQRVLDRASASRPSPGR